MKRKNERKGTQTHAVSLVSLIDPSSPVAEQYRTIRTNIQFASSADQQVKTIVVTSSGPSEGKSLSSANLAAVFAQTGDQQVKTIVVTSSGPSEGKSLSSANLAAVFAQTGQRVLLVDADLRKPTIHKTFQLNNEAGLSTVLSTGVKAGETAQKTAVENLSILTSGPKPPNPSELLGSAKMNQIMEEARNIFDIVIFDMPPVVAVTDAQIMSSKADGTLLVVRENWTRKDAITKAKELLDLVQARVLGVIYNGSEQSKDKAYYYYSD